MNLIRAALRKPITIIVMVAGLLFFGVKAARTIKIDIFPQLDLPVIYLSHPYGGFTPDQMEAYFGKNYVNLMLYVSGIKMIETRNIQGLTLLKFTFHEGTDMAQAAAEVNGFSTRAQANFPPGSVPPFIIRFDASTLPVGQLVLSSPIRTNNQLQDFANIYVRSGFTSIPGVVSPAPFGGSARTIVIKANPELLRAHNMSPDQLVAALRINNQATPAGTVRIGDKNYFTPANTSFKTVKEFENIPLFTGSVENVYLKDVATVEDGADITTGFVLVNGKRSVYLPITKIASASTWEVVKNLKKAIPRFQAVLPEDVNLSYEFDQSGYVINAVKNLMAEGIIGAILTGLMVLLFLRDPRGALIVILTIPACIISAVLFLSLFDQTINIMTLSGLALAVGILVDESTVTIENIRQHMDMGKPKALAIWDACKEIAFSKLLILFCILAVFAPAFSMKGIPGALFLPLALAISFAMIMSYLLAQTLVPILANWLMIEQNAQPKNRIAAKKWFRKNLTEDQRIFSQSGITAESEKNTWQQRALLENSAAQKKKKPSGFEKMRSRFLRFIDRLMPYRKPIVAIYLIGAIFLSVVMISQIGRDVLPRSDQGQFQVRLRDEDGTRIEKTEKNTIKALEVLNDLVGKDNIAITSAMVGMHAPTYSTNPIYLFMAGPHEAVLQAALKPDYKTDMDELKDAFREKMREALPTVKLSFEPIELTDKMLSEGSPTSIEVKIAGKNKPLNEVYANKVIDQLKRLPYLRDVQLGQAIRAPALHINIDRVRAAQLGTNVNEISRSVTTATSSSRFTEKNIWLDPRIGQGYNVQVQIPENEMTSIDNIKEIPVLSNAARPVLEDVATITPGAIYGENDNIGAMPVLSVTANLYKKDLGSAAKDVEKAIANIGELPRGLTIETKGLSTVLRDTMSSLEDGLLIAIIVIFLMLSANFQSFRVSLATLCSAPAVIAGSLGLLMLTGCTLNLQSYMGMIMSVGVSISNCVLLITNAEELRRKNGDAILSAKEAAAVRIRPILMTSIAMIAGMIPMATGVGEGGDQASPLGRAVIGGLIASTFAALFILPLAFAWIQGKSSTASLSLDPEDKESIHYIPQLYEASDNENKEAGN